ncbi:MAG: VWA domain-containing protein [Desulfocapsaceae bacterium]|nr:VWA domain-containing protein [Desulfocapsaceae bacterium]
MQFAQPIWIFIGLLSCLGLYILQSFMQKKRQRALESFAAKGLLGKLTENVSDSKRNLKLVLLLAGIFCCFLALARPQYGHHWQEVKRKGIDILFAIDTSLSMRSEDVQPNRLSRAKLAILDFVDQLSGDRVGLLPFAGSAFLLCPLTIDYLAFEESLQAVDTSIIPQQGTNLAGAIHAAEAILHNDANHKILILITDGESLQGDGLAAAKEAAARNMTVFTVGVGTPAGELIPIQQNGRREFVKDEEGNFVVSKLDEKALHAIAELSDGLYVPLGNQGQGLTSIYQRKLALLPEKDLAERRQKIPIDRFPWFLGLALVFFVGEFLLNSRKLAGGSLLFRTLQWKKNLGIILFLPFLEVLYPATGLCTSPGEEFFTANEYEKANSYYQEALEDDPENAAPRL